MNDTAILGVIFLAAVLHLAALVWAFRSRTSGSLAIVNILASVPILAYQATRLRNTLAPPPDEQIIALINFELLVLGAALGALRGGQALRIASGVAFGLHVCALVAIIVFVLTFRMTRLI